MRIKQNKTIKYLSLILIILIIQIKITFDRLPTLVNLFEKCITEQSSDVNEFQNKKYVVISSTLIDNLNDHYMFTLPMAALSWRRLNFEPIILVAQSSKSRPNRLAQIVLKYLSILKIKIVYIGLEDDNYQVLIGMVSRLFCGLLSDDLVNDNDFIITSDTDLFPISESYFKIDNKDTIKLWNYGSCDDFEYKKTIYEMQTLLHIGMLKRQWREVMSLNKNKHKLNGETILSYIRNFYDESFVKKNNEIKRGSQKTSPYWFIDQMTISVNIYNYSTVNKLANLSRIKFKGTRLNRGAFFNTKWFDKMQFDYLTDFHSFHQDVFIRWSDLRQFLHRMFDDVHKILFDEYFMDYMMVRNKMTKF